MGETMNHRADRKFLVVDDHADLRRLTAMMVEGLGYSCPDTAASGEEALRMLRATRYDFVITDINMPGMNGFMLLRAIKDDPALRGIPVLIMSTHPEELYSEAAILRGAVGYLAKPLSSTRLRAIVVQTLPEPAHPPE